MASGCPKTSAPLRSASMSSTIRSSPTSVGAAALARACCLRRLRVLASAGVLSVRAPRRDPGDRAVSLRLGRTTLAGACAERIPRRGSRGKSLEGEPLRTSCKAHRRIGLGDTRRRNKGAANRSQEESSAGQGSLHVPGEEFRAGCARNENKFRELRYEIRYETFHGMP